MKNKELQDYIKQFPDDLEVVFFDDTITDSEFPIKIERCHSEDGDVLVISGIDS